MRRSVAILLASALLSACGAEPQSCYLDKRLVAVSSDPARTIRFDKPARTTTQTGIDSDVHVIVDTSQGMQGFVRDGDQSAFVGFAQSLPSALLDLGLGARDITYLKMRDKAAPERLDSGVTAFVDLFENTTSYDQKETPLADILAAINGDADYRWRGLDEGDLVIILTDLFQDSERTDNSDITLEMTNPMIDLIVEHDLAIGLHGFKSPFNGSVYDLPAVRRDERTIHLTDGEKGKGKGVVPVYAMLIGKPADVEATLQTLSEQGEPWSVPGAEQVFLAPPASASASGVAPEIHAQITGGGIPVDAAYRGDWFALPNDALLKRARQPDLAIIEQAAQAGDGSWEPLSIQLSLSGADGARNGFRFEHAHGQLYFYFDPDQRCSRASWRAEKPAPELAIRSTGPDSARVTAFAAEADRFKDYVPRLLEITVRLAPDTRSAAPDWVGDWSVERGVMLDRVRKQVEQATTREERFVGTPHLSQIVQTLINAVESKHSEETENLTYRALLLLARRER